MLRQNIIFVENKAGSLKRVTGLLSENEVNIFGFACLDTPEFAIFRMVADQPEKAEKILTQNGYMNRIADVIAVDLDDEVGSLDKLLGAAADSNISLNYIYTSYHRQSQIPVVMIHSEEIYVTESVLRSKGYRVLESVEELNQ